MNILKKAILAASFVLISGIVFAQADWKEKDAYHEVMSKTFHPAEKGNLAPVKARSGELAERANAWRKSEIPSDIPNKKEVKKNLNKLCKESKKLNKKVKKNVSDAELKKDLFALHDTFHTVVGLCDSNEEHDH